MIDITSRAAFADELMKISTDLAKARAAMHAGWHGLDHSGKSIEGAGWFLGNKGWRSKVPLGGKSFTMYTTAMQAPGALAATDPSGQNRSRTERVMGLAGGTVGGFIGAGAMTRAFGAKHPLLKGIAGSLIGTTAGERLATSPFSAKRLLFGRPNPAAPPRIQPQTPQRPDASNNVAPGGVHSPGVITGQAQAM